MHSGTWTRIILEVAGRMVSSKFARKIKYVGKLSELSEYVPLTQVSMQFQNGRLMEDKYTAGCVCL